MPKQSKYTIKQLEQLKKDVSCLTYNEHCEIFNMIRRDSDKISENINGVFINLKYLKNETLENIVTFVAYCHKNKNDVVFIEKQLPQEVDNGDIEYLYSNYQTVDEIGEVNGSNSIETAYGIVNQKNVPEPIKVVNKKLGGIRGRIYKKCLSKVSDNKLGINDEVSTVSSKIDDGFCPGSDDDNNSSSVEYLKL